MRKICIVPYKLAVNRVYDELFCSEYAPFTFSKQHNKYRLSYRFPEKKFTKLAKSVISDWAKGLKSESDKTVFIVVDTCKIQDNYLADLYFNTLSDAKKKIFSMNAPVKYFFTDRSVRLPEDKIAEVFDHIFDEWFSEPKEDNLVFVRCSNLPCHASVTQIHSAFKGILNNNLQARINRADLQASLVKDLNEVIYSQVKDKEYPQNIEMVQYLEKMIFPYER